MRLTKPQQKLLRAIEGFQALRQNPSQHELSRVLGVTQPAIYSCLLGLEAKGVIRRDGSRHRTIEILIQSED